MYNNIRHRLRTRMKYFILLCICAVLASSVQCRAAYKLKLTRAEVTRYNKEYVFYRLWITKPTRSTNALNSELIVYKLPRDTQVKLRMYEFLSNEYRPFAISLERNLCSFMELEYKTMAYPDLLKAGAHMPEPRCPVKPGNYSFANLTPTVANYPPSLPFHNFMLAIGYWHGAVEIGVVKVYGTLDRDAVIREQYG